MEDDSENLEHAESASTELNSSPDVTPPSGCSLRKAEANRRNSRESTGPKSVQGKAHSSKNAWKHGLLTKEIVSTNPLCMEDPKEFNDLLIGLRTSYSPVGQQEDILVQEIAACIWRNKRAFRSERGEIETRLHALKSELEDSPPILEAYRDSIQLLERAKAELKCRKTFSDQTVKELYGGFSPDAITSFCEGTIRSRLAAIDRSSEMINSWHDEESSEEALRTEARAARAAIPDSSEMDQILRYGTTNDRKMYRAMAQLERLQRQRKGEPVPPAIRLEFGG